MGAEIRRKTYIRRNPTGHKELVVKRRGKQDEETLNELVRSVCDILEGIIYSGPLPTGGGAGSPEQLEYQRHPNQPDAPLMVGARGDGIRAAGESPNNMTASTPQQSDGPETSRAKSKLRATARGTPPRNKYITGYHGDNIDYGATHSESFTGTGAIGIAPTNFQVMDEEEPDEPTKDDEEDVIKSESVMSSKRVINEWDPAFKAAGYEPGDYQMPSPTGDGVAKRKSKQGTVGKYDTSTTSHGKEWPRKHNETAAMCDVDEDGTENKPQGVHVSSVGEPTDGHQNPVNHNWPDKAKNSGGGVAEPAEGNRWSDGGALTGGSGQDELTYKKGGSGMPSKGPITGTRGPQYGQPSESWSPELIGTLLGEDHNLQSLFDAYARQGSIVCLEDFQMLCRAHGIDVRLDEASILKLMKDNREYIFYEGVDANGPYWTPTPFASKSKIEEGHQRPFGQPINEVQYRTPEQEVMLGNLPEREEDSEFGEFSDRTGIGQEEYQGDPDEDVEYDEDESGGPGPYEFHNAPYDECPECGYLGSEEECPECGAFIKTGAPEDEFIGDRDMGFSPQDVDDDDEIAANWFSQSLPHDDEDDEDDTWNESREQLFDPKLRESIKRFLQSAGNIIEQNVNADRRAVGEALTQSWQYYVPGFDARHAPTRIQRSLQELAKRFPIFNPLTESDAMEHLGGNPIATGGDGPIDPKMQAPQDQPGPQDITDHGDGLGKKQKNSLEGTPVIKGTGKGLKENVEKLTKYVQKQLQEGASSLRGKFGITFSCLVQEGKHLNRTEVRTRLAEAVADVEELLQFHNNDNIVLEANFNKGRETVLTHRMPMLQVSRRRPLVAEGATLFRFKRHAEQFAQRMMQEGHTCKLVGHNWGAAVKVLAEKKEYSGKK